MEHTTDTLLTTQEVADLARVSVSTVARWAREGDLAAVRLPGRTLRFYSSDVERLLTPGQAVAS